MESSANRPLAAKEEPADRASGRPAPADADIFRAIFDHSVDAMLITSPDGRVHAANPEACRLLGMDEAEIRRRGRDGVLDGSDPRLAAMLAERARTGHFRGALHLIRGDGTIFPADLSSALFEIGDGSQRTVIVFRDVTQQREQERALRAHDAFLQALLDALPANIAVLDLDGRIRAVNEPWQTFARDNGAADSSEVTVGVNYFDVCRRATGADERGAAEALAGIARVAGGEAPRFECDYECSSPVQERWFSMQAIAVPELAAVLIVHTDITARRQADRTGAEFAAIVGSTDDAILGKSLDGTITSWNAAAERLYGYTGPEIIGRPVAELIPPGREDELQSILDRIRAGEHVQPFETTRLTKSGASVDVSLTVSPILDGLGRVIGASTIARDITAHKEGERQREQLIGDLQHALAQVRVLSGMLPICAKCKKIRDDNGVWTPLEGFIRARSNAEFSHGICPDCMKELYGEFSKP